MCKAGRYGRNSCVDSGGTLLIFLFVKIMLLSFLSTLIYCLSYYYYYLYFLCKSTYFDLPVTLLQVLLIFPTEGPKKVISILLHLSHKVRNKIL